MGKKPPYLLVEWGIALVGIGIAVFGVYFYIMGTRLVEPVHEGDLSNFEVERLGFFRDRINVLLTVTTLFLGGGGTFLVTASKPKQRRWALTVIVSAGISLLYGYLAYQTASWMLDRGFFNLAATEIVTPARAQIIALVVALAALVRSFFLAAKEHDELSGS